MDVEGTAVAQKGNRKRKLVEATTTGAPDAPSESPSAEVRARVLTRDALAACGHLAAPVGPARRDFP
jgi:hypothetical protein